ncbi:alpha/beta hydrolase [Streptomyces sp. NPDC045470]|uniref:alpha/beta hydrolase n=1 Tax=Streptomyces sp. NPDC045470 TaxID=3155469 RepID=UPI0033E70E4F
MPRGSFRGHGRSACGREAINGYAGLAADLAAVADHTDACQVFGLSMGAGVAVRLVAERSGRFRRAVLLRPTALDVPPVDSVQQLVLAVAAAAERGDRATLRCFVQRRFPASRRVSRSVAELVELRVEVLASRGGQRRRPSPPTGHRQYRRSGRGSRDRTGTAPYRLPRTVGVTCLSVWPAPRCASRCTCWGPE